MRNFVTGIILGGVVAAGGLTVVSQIAPVRDENTAGAQETAAAENAQTPPDAAAGQNPQTPAVETPDPMAKDVVTPTSEVPPAAVPDPQGLVKTPAETDEPLLRPLGDDNAVPPAAVVPDLAEPTPSADVPKTDPAPAEAEVAAPDTGGAAAENPATAPVQDEEATVQTAPPATDVETSNPPEAAADATPEAETEPPATETATGQEPAPALLVPDSQLGDKPVEGVTTGRLPSIGGTPAPAEQPDKEPALAPDAPPSIFRGYVRAFDNADAKPLFAILLIDSGAPDVPRAELSALPFPVTFVLDPMAEGSDAAATLYREAGQEVVMLATAIPKGAKASDLEQSFAGLEGKLPAAVALIDTAEAAFQDDRKLSAEVVTHLADQRLGLVTFDRGLNAADQVARREGLPAATIFRSLDDDGEDAPLIRRYLDRAAFKAAQEGKVAVIGTARPETIAALMEWAVEGRASSVALAPISALMAP